MEFTTHLGLHSQATRLLGEILPRSAVVTTGLAPSMGCGPVQEGLGRTAHDLGINGSSLTPHFPASGVGRGIQCWALPCSLAATEGILVSFFSSA